MSEETGIERYFREEKEEKYSQLRGKILSAEFEIRKLYPVYMNTSVYDSGMEITSYTPGQIVLRRS